MAIVLTTADVFSRPVYHEKRPLCRNSFLTKTEPETTLIRFRVFGGGPLWSHCWLLTLLLLLWLDSYFLTSAIG